MTQTRIDILLPFKEKISDGNEGAIASIVRDLVQLDETGQAYMVYGRPLKAPPKHLPYTALSPFLRGIFGGQNLGFAAAYLKYVKSSGLPAAIEIHGRCQVADKIARALPHVPVFLYLHNDPQQMKGAKTISQRQKLLENVAGIFCVSDYIKERFCKGLSLTQHLKNKLLTVHNGVDRWITTPQEKTKSIVIAGRLVPEKGILHACNAIIPVLKQHPDWHLHIIGGKHFAHEAPSDYEKQVRNAAAQLGTQATMHGFMEKTSLRLFQAQAEIIIVPSLWPEPAGLTNLEALAVGAALISTATGGAEEYVRNRACIVEVENNTDYTHFSYPLFSSQIAQACELLITNDHERLSLQRQAWRDYPFTAERMVKTAVKFRKNLMKSFTS